MQYKDILDTTLEQLQDIEYLRDEDKIAALIKINILCITLMDHVEKDLNDVRKLIIDLYNRKMI